MLTYYAFKSRESLQYDKHTLQIFSLIKTKILFGLGTQNDNNESSQWCPLNIMYYAHAQFMYMILRACSTTMHLYQENLAVR